MLVMNDKSDNLEPVEEVIEVDIESKSVTKDRRHNDKKEKKKSKTITLS